MRTSSVRNIWMLSREYGDLAGAGGVKDVVRQLAEALSGVEGLRVSVVLPLYGFIQADESGLKPLSDPFTRGRRLEFLVDMNYGLEERREMCRVWHGRDGKVDLYLIEAERFLEKHNVYTYTDSESSAESWKKSGAGHYDYFAMNVLLQKSSLELMIYLAEKPDIIHCHDGHTALVPALIHECQGWRSYFRDTGCLVTIHNAGMGYHQEVADLPFAHGITGLSWGSIGENRLSGKFDPLLAAGQYAVLNTVSENYARELQETDEDLRTDWLGHTLLERGRKVEGITNGINPELFNPKKAKRLGIAKGYDPASQVKRLAGKRACKKDLLQGVRQGRLIDRVEVYGSLEKDETHPLFTFIGRLSEQKGVDHFLAAIEKLFEDNEHGQVVILGNGSDFLEATVLSLTTRREMRGRICFLRGYSPQLANRLYAAGDFFVIPSRYEPCGLTDYMAQLFGTIPIVHGVGGLVKVVDGETGIVYNGGSAEALQEALVRALRLYEDSSVLRGMQRRAVEVIRKKYTWGEVMKQYMRLYEQAKEQRAEERGPNG